MLVPGGQHSWWGWPKLFSKSQLSIFFCTRISLSSPNDQIECHSGMSNEVRRAFSKVIQGRCFSLTV